MLFFQFPLGLNAFAGAEALVVTRAADETRVLARTPWGIVLMVCGRTTPVGLLQENGGMELFTTLLSRLATPGTIDGVIAFVTGAISLYSSTSGIVLPAFLPTEPGRVAELGGRDPLAIWGARAFAVAIVCQLGAGWLADVAR